jgi:hypothetical protein
MGRRSRQRAREAGPPAGRGEELSAPSATYSDEAGGELELRGALTPSARLEYQRVLAGGLEREDAWQRAAELLFERLAVSWTVAGVRTERQRELLGRYRMASADERRFVREALRAHVREHFPELTAP